MSQTCKNDPGTPLLPLGAPSLISYLFFQVLILAMILKNKDAIASTLKALHNEKYYLIEFYECTLTNLYQGCVSIKWMWILLIGS